MAKKKAGDEAPKKRPRQKHLPDMEPPSIPELDKLAESYVNVRNQRMSLTKEETDAHDILLIKMREHNLTTYEYDGFSVTIDAKEKVKVRRKKEEPLESGDEAE